ncbi:unnamed protein product [Staurois parvus]|uniref:NYN domain-containing protein n=1 Tax=Staurois parvus TaxID=386267 RepID=A0ABN9E0M9_9NEOB|nr:unnamed protein product [Staurois parvus]
MGPLLQCHQDDTVLLVGGDEDFFFFTLIAFTPIKAVKAIISPSLWLHSCSH